MSTVADPPSIPQTPASSYVAIPDPIDMYGSTTDAPPLPDVSKQDTRADVEALRASFASGATKDVRTRRSLLRALQRLVDENEAVISEAVWKDLHKHPQELFATEVSLLKAELQDFIDYVDDWAKPQLKATNVVNLPGLSYVRPEPLGVVCVIGTWNYPVNLLLMPLVAALGAGNCVVVRLPGDDTTRHLNNVLIRLFDKYMDKRYVRVVYGGVEETKKMLQERYDLIFATGGNFLGKIVAQAAAQHLTPTVLELGGKSPCIVDGSADLKLAAKRIAWGAFVNAGQTCVRPDYLLVDAKFGDQFVKLLEEEVAAQYGGENVKESDSFGRVVNQRMYARLARMLEKDSEHVSYGGDSDDKQCFISPTLLNFRSDFDSFVSSASMSEEIFGPLLPIYYYGAGDLDEAINFVIAREKPLSLYHFSSNGANKERVVNETSAGSMMLNDVLMQLSNAHVPFGGVGNSGMGAYHGHYGFEAFSHYKTVIYKNGLLDLPQRYAPYTPAKKFVLGIAMYPFTRLHMRLLKSLGFAAVLAIIAVIIKFSV
ncbi:Fatty aldehyde dehydrogenase [Phytophthora fragariae]|uniref:Aldehyde dehydrogenase n=1 Tax=Phytophthora fragariae TaxID=53985 RepID=A0A6A3WUB8_9STRA|nr:Fatty aldehyde dehydrogenase [Phytophthora fragariae]KAE8925516.1 Fatty aldehyde dehydrogenase [Phytophthora fragariae]KAE9079087.1 Fatty aldehyde dehydrogenase [Phytophthora fragariae]KAE9079160.1 Fatty aldehyde dehydrogenase [Phytophthora fragariae]KAE9100781.1 Fatty aldehyde dehydrogenase [Phytophthora fragariae]